MCFFYVGSNMNHSSRAPKFLFRRSPFSQTLSFSNCRKMTTYIATAIAQGSTFPEAFSSKYHEAILASGAKIEKTVQLSAGKAFDYYLSPPTESVEAFVADLKSKLFNLSKEAKVDIIFQQDTEARKHKGLFVFDMDSTLIQQEVIDMIAAYANVEDEVSKITEAAMNGEIDFNESLTRRVGLLKGVRSDVFELLKADIRFTPGAHELCRALKKLGVKMAVLSGGFIPLAKWVKAELGLDYAYANTLEISEDGKELTGKPLGRIVNNVVKAELLKEIAEKENVPLEKAVAVGDGSNDLLMMAAAGFGIAFNAKPIVQLKAPSKINTPTLQTVLYVLGYNDEEIKKLVE